MRISLFITAACLLIVGAGVRVVPRSQALSMSTSTPAEATRVADVTPVTGGIQTWTRMMERGGLETSCKAPQTWSVPSDYAFQSLPTDELQSLLSPGRSDARR